MHDDDASELVSFAQSLPLHAQPSIDNDMTHYYTAIRDALLEMAPQVVVDSTTGGQPVLYRLLLLPLMLLHSWEYCGRIARRRTGTKLQRYRGG